MEPFYFSLFNQCWLKSQVFWAVLTTCLAFWKNTTQLYVLRFFIGRFAWYTCTWVDWRGSGNSDSFSRSCRRGVLSRHELHDWLLVPKGRDCKASRYSQRQRFNSNNIFRHSDDCCYPPRRERWSCRLEVVSINPNHYLCQLYMLDLRLPGCLLLMVWFLLTLPLLALLPPGYPWK